MPRFPTPTTRSLAICLLIIVGNGSASAAEATDRPHTISVALLATPLPARFRELPNGAGHEQIPEPPGERAPALAYYKHGKEFSPIPIGHNRVGQTTAIKTTKDGQASELYAREEAKPAAHQANASNKTAAAPEPTYTAFAKLPSPLKEDLLVCLYRPTPASPLLPAAHAAIPLKNAPTGSIIVFNAASAPIAYAFNNTQFALRPGEYRILPRFTDPSLLIRMISIGAGNRNEMIGITSKAPPGGGLALLATYIADRRITPKGVTWLWTEFTPTVSVATATPAKDDEKRK